MPDMDGFAVLAALDQSALPATVFVTAYDQYALRAFDAHAVDYLLKPYDTERFEEALKRVRQWLATGSDAADGERLRRLIAAMLPTPNDGATPRGPRRLALRVDGRLRMVSSAQVDWLESDGNYVRVHVGRAAHLIRNTLVAFEGELDRQQFARIHRRFIVNLDRVTEVQPWFAGDSIVILADGTKLRLSRTYREEFLARFLGDRQG
jgi:two-component system, LytTR family, response regulator